MLPSIAQANVLLPRNMKGSSNRLRGVLMSTPTVQTRIIENHSRLLQSVDMKVWSYHQSNKKMSLPHPRMRMIKYHAVAGVCCYRGTNEGVVKILLVLT